MKPRNINKGQFTIIDALFVVLNKNSGKYHLIEVCNYWNLMAQGYHMYEIDHYKTAEMYAHRFTSLKAVKRFFIRKKVIVPPGDTFAPIAIANNSIEGSRFYMDMTVIKTVIHPHKNTHKLNKVLGLHFDPKVPALEGALYCMREQFGSSETVLLVVKDTVFAICVDCDDFEWEIHFDSVSSFTSPLYMNMYERRPNVDFQKALLECIELAHKDEIYYETLA